MSFKFNSPVVLISLLILFTQCSKQDDQIPESNTSMRFFLESGIEVIGKSISTSDGGILHAGQVGIQAFMLKLSADGSREWYKTYGHEGKEFFYDVTEMKNGDFVAVGASTSNAPGDLNSNASAYVVLASHSGEQKWEYNSNWSPLTGLTCVEEDMDGNIVAGGFVSISSASSLILKLTPQGKRIFQWYYGIGPWHDGFRDITFTKDGDYVMWGLESPSNYVVEIRKVYLNRTVLSKDSADYMGSYNYPEVRNEGNLSNFSNSFFECQEDENGNVFVAMETNDLTDTRYIRLSQISSTGNLISKHELFRGDDYVPEFFKYDKGKIIIAGGTEQAYKGKSQMTVFELDKNGGIIWQNTFGNDLGLQSATYYADFGDHYALSGLIGEASSGKTKFVYFKSDRSGNIQ